MAAPQAKKIVEISPEANEGVDDHLAEILHQQLDQLIWHVSAACAIPKCSECTRMFRVRKILLFTFR